MARTWIAVGVVAAFALASDAAPGGAGGPGSGASSTKITIWGGGAFGGATYAGGGATISERREVELTGGELRVVGIASTVDAASVQVRDLTEPGAAVTEQRFVPGATTPTELLARHIGDAITAVTAKGDVSGVLRAADDQAIVVEVGAGDQRRLAVLRREYVQDVRLPVGAGGDRPSLVWRTTAKKPGAHSVELTYRATGMAWGADYLAVLDDATRTVDFAAWATIKNATGAAFERAELTLLSAGGAAPTGVAALAGAKGPAVQRFRVPGPIKLGAGDAVQVELVPARQGVKALGVVAYEPMEDPSAGYQDTAATDCTENSATGPGAGTAELALEVALASAVTLPEGRVRLFRRLGDRLELLVDDALKSSAGAARIKLTGDAEVTGERKALSCTVDERAKTIHERIQVRVDNKSKQPVDAVIREYVWRWPAWRLEAEDRKSTRIAPQTLEYRVHVPANGAQTVTYSVVYSW